jgi:hypothetical protein
MLVIFLLPSLPFAYAQARNDVLHICAAGYDFRALRQHLEQNALSRAVDASYIFEVNDAPPALTRAARLFPLPFEVNGPIAAQTALKNPSLFERGIRDHCSEHWRFPASQNARGMPNRNRFEKTLSF